MRTHILEMNPENIKQRVNEKLHKNPELLYHIENPFLKKYIDIVIESICEEISSIPQKTISTIESELYFK